MTPTEFLTSVWPSDGYYVIATPFTPKGAAKAFYTHKVCDTVDEAVRYAKWAAATRDVFFCVHSLREREVWVESKKNYKTGELGAMAARTKENMLASKAFFLDLDVGSGDGKYPTQAHALADLKQFCATAGLPRPMIVSSGGGVHVYWLMTEDVPSDTWVAHAHNLKSLCRRLELKADPARTSDQASVLRVVGTYNHKDAENLRLVKTLASAKPQRLEDFTRVISDALIRVGEHVREPEVYKDTLGLGARPAFTDLGSNTSREFDGPKTSAKEIGRQCGQFRFWARQNGNLPEPEWYKMIQLVRLTPGGEQLCHSLSQGGHTYNADDLDARLARLEAQSIGAPMCESIRAVSSNPSLCDKCVWFSKAKTPIYAAWQTAKAPAPVVAPADPHDEELVIPDPPPPFRRTPEGFIAMEQKLGEDQDVQSLPVLDYDLFPLKRIHDLEQDTEKQLWRAILPRSGARDFELTAQQMYRSDALAVALADKGVYPHNANISRIQHYMSAYIAQLQREHDAGKSYTSLGWHDDHTIFVMPDRTIHRDGRTTTSTLTASAESATQAFAKGGTLEKQIELLKFYDHPSYKPQQLMVLASLAAPLYHMSGHAGVIVNATGVAGSSKSTSLYTASAIWAHPFKYPLNGTHGGATARARLHRVTTMGSLPVCMDEITDIPYKDAQGLAMSITQPAPRTTLTRDSKERKQPLTDKSTIMLCTANSSLHNLLSYENSAGTAGSMRVFEMKMRPQSIHTKAEADAYIREMRENYGHLGEVFLTYVVQNYEKVDELVRRCIEIIDTRCAVTGAERFWSAVAGCAVAAGYIAAKLGLISFSAKDLNEWVILEQFPQMRGTITQEYSSPMAVLADYLETIDSSIIAVDRVGRGETYVKRAPRGPLMAHYDTTNGEMWVLKTGFKDYCTKAGANSVDILSELAAPDTAVGHTHGRLVSNTSTKKTLGLGTEFGKAQSRCFVLNMRHPQVTGAVDLAVLEGGKAQSAPVRALKKT